MSKICLTGIEEDTNKIGLHLIISGVQCVWPARFVTLIVLLEGGFITV